MPRKAYVEQYYTLSEIKTLITDFEKKDNVRMCKRLSLVKKVMTGKTIVEASKELDVSSKTGGKWLKSYNNGGLKGLIPKYYNCGRKALLSDGQLQYIKDKITADDASYNIKQVQKLIKEEFNIEYSYNHVWYLVRKKLKLNYGKPWLMYDDRPENHKEILKENAKGIKRGFKVVYTDETRIQNEPNLSRKVYDPKKRNVMKRTGKKFGTSATGFLNTKGESYIEMNNRNNRYTFSRSICNFVKVDSNNDKIKQCIEEALNNPNLKEENIEKELNKKQMDKYDLINKVNDELYSDKSDEEILTKVGKICEKQKSNNKKKILEIQTERIVENLKNTEISELRAKEERIYLVLDNARIHKADVVKEVCDILNIEPIYLPKYCPDLNPIEDVWRIMKKEIRTMKYTNEEELVELCKKEFYEAVKNETLYEEWIKEYCTA